MESSVCIVYDGEIISAPVVEEPILGGEAIINGMADIEEAKNLATSIRIGGLKVELEELRSNVVGAQLGGEAISTSLKAGVIGLAIVCLFMTIVYLLPGFAASIALVSYVAIMILILSTTGISLTLPGIAGIILSIGMAVDANVIIFERFKEELKGKVAPERAFDRSFKASSSAIIDGNVTTFTVAILLYIFGMSSIKGFGILLAIGVLLSLFTSMVVTKYLLRQLLPVIVKHPKLFATSKEVK